MAPVIRALDVTDAEQLHSLRLRALRDAPDAFLATLDEDRTTTVEVWRDRLRRRFTDPTATTFGAFIDDQLLGMFSAVRGERARVRHKVMLVAMFVAAELRGRGVGGRLLDEMIAYQRALDEVELLQLSVVTTNAAACRLYQSRGFVTYGRELKAMKLDGRYLDEELMVLAIR